MSVNNPVPSKTLIEDLTEKCSKIVYFQNLTFKESNNNAILSGDNNLLAAVKKLGYNVEDKEYMNIKYKGIDKSESAAIAAIFWLPGTWGQLIQTRARDGKPARYLHIPNDLMKKLGLGDVATAVKESTKNAKIFQSLIDALENIGANFAKTLNEQTAKIDRLLLEDSELKKQVEDLQKENQRLQQKLVTAEEALQLVNALSTRVGVLESGQQTRDEKISALEKANKEKDEKIKTIEARLEKLEVQQKQHETKITQHDKDITELKSQYTAVFERLNKQDETIEQNKNAAEAAVKTQKIALEALKIELTKAVATGKSEVTEQLHKKIVETERKITDKYNQLDGLVQAGIQTNQEIVKTLEAQNKKTIELEGKVDENLTNAKKDQDRLFEQLQQKQAALEKTQAVEKTARDLEVANLKQQYEQVTNNLSELEKKHNALEQSVKERFQKVNEKLDKQEETLKEHTASIKKQVSDLETTKKDQEANLNKMEEKLREEITTGDANTVQTLMNEIAVAQSLAETTSARIEALEKNKEQYHAAIKKILEDKEKATTDLLAAMESKLNAAQLEKKEITQKLEELNKQVGSVGEKAKATLDARMQGLEKSQAAITERMDKLEKEKRELVEKVKQENGKIWEELLKQASSVTALASKLETELKNAKDDQINLFNQLTEKQQLLESTQGQQGTEQIRQTKEIQFLQTQYDQVTKKVGELDTKHNALEKSVKERFTAVNATLEAQAKTLQDHAVSIQGNIDALMDTKTERAATLNALEEKLQASILSSNTAMQQQFTSQINEVKQSVIEMNAKITQLETDVRTYKKEINDILGVQFRLTVDRLGEMDKKLNTAQMENTKITQKLSELKTLVEQQKTAGAANAESQKLLQTQMQSLEAAQKTAETKRTEFDVEKQELLTKMQIQHSTIQAELEEQKKTLQRHEKEITENRESLNISIQENLEAQRKLTLDLRKAIQEGDTAVENTLLRKAKEFGQLMTVHMNNLQQEYNTNYREIFQLINQQIEKTRALEQRLDTELRTAKTERERVSAALLDAQKRLQDVAGSQTELKNQLEEKIAGLQWNYDDHEARIKVLENGRAALTAQVGDQIAALGGRLDVYHEEMYDYVNGLQENQEFMEQRYEELQESQAVLQTELEKKIESKAEKSEISELNNRISQVDSLAQQTKASLGVLQAETRDALTQQTEAIKQVQQTVSDELRKAEEKQQEFNDQIAKKQEALKKAQKEQQKQLQEEIDGLSKAQTRSREDTQRLRSQYNKLSSDVQKQFEVVNDKLQEQQTELGKQKKEIEKNRTELTSKLDGYDKKLSDLNQDLSQKIAQGDEETRKTLMREINTVNELVAQTNKDLERVEQENIENRSEIRIALAAQANQIRTIQSSIRDQLKVAEAEKRRVDAALLQVQTQLETVRDESDAKQKALKQELEAKIQTLTQEQNAQKQTVDNLQIKQTELSQQMLAKFTEVNQQFETQRSEIEKQTEVILKNKAELEESLRKNVELQKKAEQELRAAIEKSATTEDLQKLNDRVSATNVLVQNANERIEAVNIQAMQNYRDVRGQLLEQGKQITTFKQDIDYKLKTAQEEQEKLSKNLLEKQAALEQIQKTQRAVQETQREEQARQRNMLLQQMEELRQQKIRSEKDAELLRLEQRALAHNMQQQLETVNRTLNSQRVELETQKRQIEENRAGLIKSAQEQDINLSKLRQDLSKAITEGDQKTREELIKEITTVNKLVETTNQELKRVERQNEANHAEVKSTLAQQALQITTVEQNVRQELEAAKTKQARVNAELLEAKTQLSAELLVVKSESEATKEAHQKLKQQLEEQIKTLTQEQSAQKQTVHNLQIKQTELSQQMHAKFTEVNKQFETQRSEIAKQTEVILKNKAELEESLKQNLVLQQKAQEQLRVAIEKNATKEEVQQLNEKVIAANLLAEQATQKIEAVNTKIAENHAAVQVQLLEQSNQITAFKQNIDQKLKTAQEEQTALSSHLLAKQELFEAAVKENNTVLKTELTAEIETLKTEQGKAKQEMSTLQTQQQQLSDRIAQQFARVTEEQQKQQQLLTQHSQDIQKNCDMLEKTNQANLTLRGELEAQLLASKNDKIEQAKVVAKLNALDQKILQTDASLSSFKQESLQKHADIANTLKQQAQDLQTFKTAVNKDLDQKKIEDTKIKAQLAETQKELAASQGLSKQQLEQQQRDLTAKQEQTVREMASIELKQREIDVNIKAHQDRARQAEEQHKQEQLNASQAGKSFTMQYQERIEILEKKKNLTLAEAKKFASDILDYRQNNTVEEATINALEVKVDGFINTIMADLESLKQKKQNLENSHASSYARRISK